MGDFMSNEPIWFVYANEQQLGPFTKAQLYQQFQSNELQADVLLFQSGWKEWLSLEACLPELGLPIQLEGKSISLQDRRRKGPRVSIAGQIIVHNQGDLAIGSGVDLSATGLFVATTQQLFRVGEVLSLTCKIKELPTPFHAKAEVVRFNVGNAATTGFGLRWTEIAPPILQEIQKLSGGNAPHRMPPPPIPVKKAV